MEPHLSTGERGKRGTWAGGVKRAKLGRVEKRERVRASCGLKEKEGQVGLVERE
jgi:hypothetical protein